MEKIAAAARRVGKHWGRPVSSTDQAQLCLDMGARFIAHNSDLMILKHGLEDIQRRLERLGFHFDNLFHAASTATAKATHRLGRPHHELSARSVVGEP
jgi:hypothetical protein